LLPLLCLSRAPVGVGIFRRQAEILAA
jgi:hypothetical protein